MAFQNVFTHGNLVDVNVSMWTGERRLQAEDLGLDKKKVSGAFTLGRKKLIPPEEIGKFKHFDYKARVILERYSFQFQFGGARFVPKKAFMEFVEEMDALIKEYNQAADEFTEKYPKLKLEMRKWYLDAAKQAHKRMCSIRGYDVDETRFINKYLERVDKFYPNESDIRRKFNMEYLVFRMSLPDLSQANYGDLAEENEKIKLMEAAYQRSLQKKVEAFVDKIVEDLRKKAATVLERVATVCHSTGKVLGSSWNSIHDLIAEYERMNIVGDDRFEGMLKAFQKDYLQKYTTKQVRDDRSIQLKFYKELKRLADFAIDHVEIATIADNYRRRINL